MKSLRRADLTLLGLLFLISLLLRVSFLIPGGFDGLYGQDAYAYYTFAGNLRSFVNTGQPLPAFFWPLGYPALLAAGFALFGASAAGQALNVLMGAALAPLVYILARRMQSGRVGAVTAGLLLAVCGQAVQSSLVLMADIPALFWALLSAITLVAYHSAKGRLVWLVAAAVFLALACLTRWLYLALLPAWGAALLLNRGTRWRDVLIAGFIGLLVLLPQCAYSATNPHPLFNHAWVQGWSPGNFFQHEFTNTDGDFVYTQPNALFYARPLYDAYYLAPLVTPLVVAGLLALVWRRQILLLVMLAGWVLLPYLFLAGIPYQNIRFPLIIFPAAALLAGFGLETAVGWLDGRGAGRTMSTGALLLVIAGVGQTVSTVYPVVTTFIANQQADKAVVERVAARLPANAVVYTFGLTLALRHYTDFQVSELYYGTPETLAQQWQPGQSDYLLVDPWNLNSQWAGREPQSAVQWLAAHRGLTRIGTYGHYVLYRIGA